MRKVVAAIGIAGLVFALGACGGDDDTEAAERIAEELAGEDVDIDTEDGSVNIETDEGSVSIGSGEIPEEMADYPIPDDAEVTSSFSGGSEESGFSATVTLAANGDAADVADEMQSGFEDLGFTVSGEFTGESNGTAMASFTFEGDGQTGGVNVTEDDTTEGYNLTILVSVTEDTTATSEG